MPGNDSDAWHRAAHRLIGGEPFAARSLRAVVRDGVSPPESCPSPFHVKHGRIDGARRYGFYGVRFAALRQQTTSHGSARRAQCAGVSRAIATAERARAQARRPRLNRRTTPSFAPRLRPRAGPCDPAAGRGVVDRPGKFVSSVGEGVARRCVGRRRRVGLRVGAPSWSAVVAAAGALVGSLPRSQPGRSSPAEVCLPQSPARHPQ